jgi:hypothetical protein
MLGQDAQDLAAAGGRVAVPPTATLTVFEGDGRLASPYRPLIAPPRAAALARGGPQPGVKGVEEVRLVVSRVGREGREARDRDA